MHLKVYYFLKVQLRLHFVIKGNLKRRLLQSMYNEEAIYSQFWKRYRKQFTAFIDRITREIVGVTGSQSIDLTPVSCNLRHPQHPTRADDDDDTAPFMKQASKMNILPFTCCSSSCRLPVISVDCGEASKLSMGRAFDSRLDSRLLSSALYWTLH